MRGALMRSALERLVERLDEAARPPAAELERVQVKRQAIGVGHRELACDGAALAG